MRPEFFYFQTSTIFMHAHGIVRQTNSRAFGASWGKNIIWYYEKYNIESLQGIFFNCKKCQKPWRNEIFEYMLNTYAKLVFAQSEATHSQESKSHVSFATSESNSRKYVIR